LKITSIVLLTGIAMLAFAANSVLCRLALGHDEIDATGFTAIRLAAGALVLAAIIAARRQKTSASQRGSWISASMLFLYAASFSLAYRQLSSGTGALILFGSVQLTMWIAAHRTGERAAAPEWMGLILAFGGLIYLVAPGIAAPPPLGAALMGVAGVAWGVYSIRGRGAQDPLAVTAGNFIRCVPIVIVAMLIAIRTVHMTPTGILLAAISGAITSGLGYVIWYSVLPLLTKTRAALVQLSVPIIAALGGTAFLGERITARLIIASLLVLGGIALAIGASSFAPKQS